MTLEELSKKIGVSEKTLRNQYKREVEKLARQGIIIHKTGRGLSASYSIEYDTLFNDQRALTIFEEEKSNIFLAEDMLKMMNWNLLIFMGICITPMLVFRGSYKDFLNYVGIPATTYNITLLKETLEEMNNEFIAYLPDKTDDNYFVASIYRQVEQDYKIPIMRLRACRQIQMDNNGKSFVPLLKVWMAIEKAVENQPYTIEDISNMTGLSKDTVRRTSKQLRDVDVYINEKDFDSLTQTSRGVNSTFNAFYDYLENEENA